MFGGLCLLFAGGVIYTYVSLGNRLKKKQQNTTKLLAHISDIFVVELSFELKFYFALRFGKVFYVFKIEKFQTFQQRIMLKIVFSASLM